MYYTDDSLDIGFRRAVKWHLFKGNDSACRERYVIKAKCHGLKNVIVTKEGQRSHSFQLRLFSRLDV